MSSPKDFTSCQASSSRRKRPVTSRRKQDGNPSDEQSPPAKRQKTQTPQKKSGVAHKEGQEFEINMAAVIGLRGTARGDDFQLSTNKAGCGNFDDLVYTTGKTRYFLQLKHTEKPGITKLVRSDLVPLLHKCFESYCSIIQDPNFKELESSEFIIYTNKQLGPKLFPHNRQQRVIDEIFKTCDTGEIFNFTPHENKETDVYTGVENLVKESTEFGDLSPTEQEVKLNMVSKFLEKLIMATGQKGQNGIDNVIIEEIRKIDVVTIDPKLYQTELHHFKTLLESWWKIKKEKMAPEILRNWLQEAKTKACAPVVGSLFESCKQKIFGTEIKFSNSEISRLQTEISNKRAVHLRSDALELCSKLLLDCLDTSKCIFVPVESPQCTKHLLLHAWLGGHWEWLIVFCDSADQQSVISGTCIKISEIIKSDHSTKRVIILTTNSVQEIKDFVTVKHNFNFEQLSEESQEIVLDKAIDFQGREVKMRSVLQRHGNVQHVLGPELVTDMIKEETPVNIGGRLKVNTGYYAPRVLERKVWLHRDVLRTSNDVFVVSGTTKEDLLKIVPSGKIVEKSSVEEINSSDFTEDMRGGIFLLPYVSAKNSFLAVCNNFQGTNLHWVEFQKGKLLWKMSSAGTEALLDYIDADTTRGDKRTVIEFMKRGNCEVSEESIWDLGERTVLVVDEPGMGKSSTTTHVARHTKLADPTSWVVHINWNDHNRKLQEINTTTFRFNSLVEFLCSAAFTESKYADINRNLLKQALQNSGNVTVFMDGFDEVSPTYADKAAVILSELMKTNVGRVWVTSRPVEREKLERELSVIAFGMKRLSRESQVEMLRKMRTFKASDDEYKLHNFLSRLNESVHDENFTGSPLYITMIATVYEVDVETHLISEYSGWPEIDLVKLYEVFVERKLHIYLTDKQKADIANPSVQDNLKVLKETRFSEFEKCALVAILPPTVLESLHDKKIEEEIQSFLATVQAGEDKTGIVMNVVDGKPQFVHRTFAEFFTARWFSRNFKQNRSVLEHIFLADTYMVMTAMFDRMLSEGCPPHCATFRMHGDTVFKEERCFEAVDKGGRTVMHLIGRNKYFQTSLHWNKLNSNSSYKASLQKTDSVLHWTPMQYAISSRNWFIVEKFLESYYDKSGLDMIKQRAQDPNYIDAIAEDAVDSGYVVLLDYLGSIGVDIFNANFDRYDTALLEAIHNYDLEMVKCLIRNGANCNIPNNDYETPLFYTLSSPYDIHLLGIVQAMLARGASLDAHNDDCTIVELAGGWKRWPSPVQYALKVIVQYLEERLRINHESKSEGMTYLCVSSSKFSELLHKWYSCHRPLHSHYV